MQYNELTVIGLMQKQIISGRHTHHTCQQPTTVYAVHSIRFRPDFVRFLLSCIFVKKYSSA